MIFTCARILRYVLLLTHVSCFTSYLTLELRCKCKSVEHCMITMDHKTLLPMIKINDRSSINNKQLDFGCNDTDEEDVAGPKFKKWASPREQNILVLPDISK